MGSEEASKGRVPKPGRTGDKEQQKLAAEFDASLALIKQVLSELERRAKEQGR